MCSIHEQPTSLPSHKQQPSLEDGEDSEDDDDDDDDSFRSDASILEETDRQTYSETQAAVNPENVKTSKALATKSRPVVKNV